MSSDVLKQSIYLIATSVLVILFSKYVVDMLNLMSSSYSFLSSKMSVIFSGDHAGLTIRHAIALVAIAGSQFWAPTDDYLKKNDLLGHFYD